MTTAIRSRRSRAGRGSSYGTALRERTTLAFGVGILPRHPWVYAVHGRDLSHPCAGLVTPRQSIQPGGASKICGASSGCRSKVSPGVSGSTLRSPNENSETYSTSLSPESRKAWSWPG